MKSLEVQHKGAAHPSLLGRPPCSVEYHNARCHMPKAQLANPRKRPNSEQRTCQQNNPSDHISKKQKRGHTRESQFPSAFWDNLSKIDLTTRALEELDRRNTQAALHSRPTPRRLYRPLTRSVLVELRKSSQPLIPAVDYLRHCGAKVLKSVKQIARHGGPGLSDLRGVSQPRIH